MDFSPAKYIMTEHLKDQFTLRVGPKEVEKIQDILKRGKVILETDAHRYIKSGDLRFPCAKEKDGSYIVKSVITSNMYMSAK